MYLPEAKAGGSRYSLGFIPIQARDALQRSRTAPPRPRAVTALLKLMRSGQVYGKEFEKRPDGAPRKSVRLLYNGDNQCAPPPPPLRPASL